MQDNPGRVITKYQFSSLFSAAWYKAIKPKNILSGFQKAGINCPFNAEAIVVGHSISFQQKFASDRLRFYPNLVW